MDQIPNRSEIPLEIKGSVRLAHLAPCPVCWAYPRQPCNFKDNETPERYKPKYHWARLERYERHMHGTSRSVYLSEISRLSLLDLMAIFFRRLEYEQASLKRYHIGPDTTRETLITILLPTGS